MHGAIADDSHILANTGHNIPTNLVAPLYCWLLSYALRGSHTLERKSSIVRLIVYARIDHHIYAAMLLLLSCKRDSAFKVLKHKPGMGSEVTRMHNSIECKEKAERIVVTKGINFSNWTMV